MADASAAVNEHRLPGGLTLQLTPDCGEKQGLGLWTLGVAAACWAVSNDGRRELGNRRVLELGSGVGLAGLACGAVAAEVTLTDYDDEVLHKLRHHVALNQTQLQATAFRVAQLDWDAAPSGSPVACKKHAASAMLEPEPQPESELPVDLQDALGVPARLFDVVLGADVCYSGMAQVPDLFASDDADTDNSDEDWSTCPGANRPSKKSWDNSANVAQTIAWCMAWPHGVAHLFVHEGRSPDEVARFTSRAEELGMIVADRVPLLQRDFVGEVSTDATDNVAAPVGTLTSAPKCMHDYTQESGLVHLKVHWNLAGE